MNADPFSIEGYLGEEEYYLLGKMGAQAELAIVEIGAFRGRSTCGLAFGAQVPVYTIDPHEPFVADSGVYFPGGEDRAAFIDNITKYKLWNTVRLINLPAVQVARGWDRPIDLLWIDGDHREDVICAEVRAWHKFIIPGGYLLMHDTPTEGVQAAMRYLDSISEFECYKNTPPIAIYRKSYA